MFFVFTRSWQCLIYWLFLWFSDGPKPFSEIPGPCAVPFFGSQWLYVWPGPYSLDKLHIANRGDCRAVFTDPCFCTTDPFLVRPDRFFTFPLDKFMKYGPIVKENHLWNFPIIHLYDKKDIENVLRHPSKYPIRPELEAQSSYRRSRPDRYNSVGIVNTWATVLITLKLIDRCWQCGWLTGYQSGERVASLTQQLGPATE